MEHQSNPPSDVPATHSPQTVQHRDQDRRSNSFFEPGLVNGANASDYSANYIPHSAIDVNYHGLPSQGHGDQMHNTQAMHAESSFSMSHASPNGLNDPAAATSFPSTESNARNRDTDTVPPFRFNEQDYGTVAVDPNLLDFGSNTLQHIPDASAGLSYTSDVVLMGAPNSPQSDGQSLPALSHHQSATTTANVAPGFKGTSFHTNTFSRPREPSASLDPSSAMFPNNEWTQLNTYRGHHRTASDNISEFSSHSNQASPYLATLDSFDTSQASPMLGASQDPAFNTDLGLQQFTLSDAHHSPAHSPGHSPHISPQQQSIPLFATDSMFSVPSTGVDEPFPHHRESTEMFPSISRDAFPPFHQHSPGDFGAADQMSPPEINIDYAPPSRSPFEQNRAGNVTEDTLSPPPGYLGRSRERAKSDSFAGSRSSTPGFSTRGRLPSLQSEDSRDKLSPFHNQSRSPSPGRGRTGSLGNRARSSSAASDHRDYILDLANPERSPSNGGDSKRVQKHPATFQCTLCPKRFTRAYNLRSHLRTHTDERPFVCTVCGKAFARQHDRKRHEGLHSGEKKFVCRGLLQNNSSWGCGRRFARADALGRHFRSEAGRVCIKPLLDEEIAEKRKQMAEEQQHAQFTSGITVQQSMMNSPPLDVMSTFLPAAILQQYPALAQIDWSAMQSAPQQEDEYGRTSFDASSGGDYDLSENEASDYADTSNINMTMMEGIGLGVNGQNAQHHLQRGALSGPVDYLDDFDGR